MSLYRQDGYSGQLLPPGGQRENCNIKSIHKNYNNKHLGFTLTAYMPPLIYKLKQNAVFKMIFIKNIFAMQPSDCFYPNTHF